MMIMYPSWVGLMDARKRSRGCGRRDQRLLYHALWLTHLTSICRRTCASSRRQSWLCRRLLRLILFLFSRIPISLPSTPSASLSNPRTSLSPGVFAASVPNVWAAILTCFHFLFVPSHLGVVTYTPLNLLYTVRRLLYVLELVDDVAILYK